MRNSATLVAVTEGQDTSDINFKLDRGGSISGMTYDFDGTTPLGGVNVSAYSESGGFGHTRSRQDGSYQIEGLTSGSYTVEAEASDRGYFRVFYDGVTDFEAVSLVLVTVGADTPNIDFTMLAGGSISGQVVTANPGEPLGGVEVWAQSYDCCGGGNGARTLPDGTYEIIGLAPGDYRVRAQQPDAGLVGMFFDNTTDWIEATRVPVAAGETTPNINFALGVGGSISGVVYRSDGVTPIAGADVWASDYVCCEGGGNGALTAADGSYTISGLPGGDYRVQASKPGYAFEFYDSTSSFISSTAVTVLAGRETPNITFTLDLAGTISGIVTEAVGGAPVPGANVFAHSESGGGGGTVTGQDGKYVIESLAPGVYIVGAEKDGFILEFWKETSNHISSTPVTVDEGADTPNIDFTLDRGGSISGTVVAAAGGGPILGAEVDAFPAGGGCCGSSARTAVDGSYTVSGLVAGSYIVTAIVKKPGPGYVREFFEETPRYGSSTPVTLTAGGNELDINFTLDLGGSISGRVLTAIGGSPIAGAIVEARLPGACCGEEARTAPNGSYVIAGLAPGSYIVTAERDGFVLEFWEEKPNYDSSTPVTVTAGVNEPDINFTLDPGGSISDTVLAQGGAPVGGARVFVIPAGEPWPPSDEDGPGDRSRPDGTYRIDGVPPGDWIVIAWASDQGYVIQFYDHTIDPASSTPVTVVIGGDRANTDFDLVQGGSISGTVVSSVGSEPLGGISIYAQTHPGGVFLGFADSRPDGTYSVMGLPAGDYKLAAVDEEGLGYSDEYYDGVADPGSAAVVTVVGILDTPGKDFNLDPLP